MKERLIEIILRNRCVHSDNICNNCNSNTLLKFECEKLASVIIDSDILKDKFCGIPEEKKYYKCEQ